MGNRWRGSVREWRRLWKPRVSLRRVWIAVSIGALTATLGQFGPSGVHWIRTHPYFVLKDVEVRGNRRLTRLEVLDAAGIVEGASVWDAAPAALRMRLQGHPWIRRAVVQRRFPDHLVIGIRERHPVAIARLDQLDYVDRSGAVLGPLRDDDSRDFPVITGLERPASRELVPLGFHRVLQLLRICERTNGFDTVSEIHVDPDRGITLFPLHSAVAVVLGWGGWREKLGRSARVFAAWQGQLDRVVAVDVSLRDAVVVKLHEEPRPAAVRPSRKGVRV
jgi:cell division protein FtsQ